MDGQSLILALHARYEATWDTYNCLDRASSGRREHQLSEAMQVVARESDALRQAILYQVPNDQRDALVLATHLWSTFDLTSAFHEKEDDPDRLAFEVGLDTLLDYLFGETSDVPAGYQIGQAENITRSRRRLRTGVMEDKP